MTGHEIRRIIIEQSNRAHVGHIGSALSVADILAALYGGFLRIPHPTDRDRDRFVLSKGHAALAMYAAFHLCGWISQGELDTYCTDGTLLGVHPDTGLRGVDFATGSLGMGLPFGVGAALAARLEGSSRRVFVLMSDAECNEGSVWEAVMFAAHHRLANLVAIVDMNGQQALDLTANVLDQSSMSARWQSFGWDANVVCGHDVTKLQTVLTGLDYEKWLPHVLLANTVSGKGVSFMEGRVEWHYLPMSDEQYRQALSELKSKS
jgi:transketolase